MAKQQIKQKETEVATQNGVGKQLESILTVDDNSLPSPKELAEYQAVDPDIVKFLMDSAAKEQAHRHELDKEKVSFLKQSEARTRRINWWGMFFAFLSIVVLACLAGFALYLDRTWFAGLLGTGTLVTIVSIFVNRPDKRSLSQK